MYSHSVLIDLSMQDGFTALHLSSQEGHSVVVSVLLESGADIHSVTNVGVLKVHMCVHVYDYHTQLKCWC